MSVKTLVGAAVIAFGSVQAQGRGNSLDAIVAIAPLNKLSGVTLGATLQVAT